MADRKQVDFDEIVIGEELGPVTYTASRAEVEDHLRYIQDPNPWYRENSPFGGPIAPPTYVARDYIKLLMTKYSPNDAVHTSAAHEYRGPVMIGDTLTIRGGISEKYIRRGREYLVVESTTTNQNGQVVQKNRDVWLVNASKRRPES